MTPFAVRTTRSTLHAIRLVPVKGVSFLRPFSIPFDLYTPLRSLPLVSCQLALQAGQRLIVEKWPVSVQAYDRTFRQQDAQNGLVAWLQGILAVTFLKAAVLSHNQCASVSRRRNGLYLLHAHSSSRSALWWLVLFARLYACTSHAQPEPNKSTTRTQRQTSADMMTRHSLQTVLVVGRWLPFPYGRETSIPRPYFYISCVSRLASLLSLRVCHFCTFCRMSFLVERMSMSKKYIVNRSVDTFGMMTPGSSRHNPRTSRFLLIWTFAMRPYTCSRTAPVVGNGNGC